MSMVAPPWSSALPPIIAPFRVVIDTREQSPFGFAGIVADAAQRRRPIAVQTVRAGLPTGDYSVEGLESSIAIERKSRADIYSTIAQGRKRFARELERLAALPGFAAVVVEDELSHLLQSPPFHCQLPPKNLWRSIMAWQLRFRGVHWVFCPDRRFAEIATFRMLERFWKCSQTKDKT